MFKKYKEYRPDLRQKAVWDDWEGKGSLQQICKNYRICSDAPLRRWIISYKGHKKFRQPSDAKGKILRNVEMGNVLSALVYSYRRTDSCNKKSYPLLQYRKIPETAPLYDTDGISLY